MFPPSIGAELTTQSTSSTPLRIFLEDPIGASTTVFTTSLTQCSSSATQARVVMLTAACPDVCP